LEDTVITGWESADVLYAAAAERIGRCTSRIDAEELAVTDERGEVTVVIGLAGFLSGVRIAASLRRRYPPATVVQTVLATIGRAERAAWERRVELATTMEGT
jgi:hypothetical protein